MAVERALPRRIPEPRPSRRPRRLSEERYARKRVRKSDRTRQRIMGAAKQLFDRKGYRETTIDDITRRAEIAHGTFYLYFGSKGEVLKQLLGETFLEFDRLASHVPRSRDEIAGLVRESLQIYERNRLLMRFLREASAADPYFRQHYDQLFIGPLVDHLRATVEGALGDGRQRGSARSRAGARDGVLDSRAAARAAVGLIESFAYGMFIGGEDFSMDLAVDTLTAFCAGAIDL